MGGNGSKSADAAVAASPSKAKPSSPTRAAHTSMRYTGAGAGALGSVVGGVGGMERDMTRNFKVLVVGAPRVGKTCVLHRYLRNVYVGGAGPGGHGPPPTARVEVGLKFLEAAYFYAVQLWECPAVDWQFERLRTTWFRDATGMVIVVSTRNLESFKVIDDWKRAADEYSAELKIPPIPIIVLANRFTSPQEKDRERERLYGPPHHSSAAFQAAAHGRRSRGHMSKRSIDLADPSDLAQADETVTEATMRETAQTFQVAAGYLGSAYTGAGIDKCFRYLLQRMVARDRDWRMVSVPMPVGPGGHAHATGALSALLSAGGSQPNTQRASQKSVDDSARTDDSKIGAGAMAPGDEKYPLPAIADADGGADGAPDGGDGTGTGTGTGDGTGTGGELDPVTPAPESEDGAVLEPKTPLLDTSLAEDGGDEVTSGAIGRRSAGASAGAPFARRGTGGPKRTGSFGFDGKLPDGSGGGGGGGSPPKTPDGDAAGYNARGSVLGMSIAEGDEEYSVSKNNMRDLSRAGSAHGARPISGGGGGGGDGMADAGFDAPQTIVGHGPDEAPATEEELAAAAATAAAEAAALEAAADAAAAGAAAAELMAADTQADADLAASEKELAAKEAEINAQMAELERLEAAASAAVAEQAGGAAADGGVGAGPSAPASSPVHAAGDAGAPAHALPESVHAEAHAEAHAEVHVADAAPAEPAYATAAEPAAATVAAEVHAETVAPAEPEPVAPASLAELTDAIAAAYQSQPPAEAEAAPPADADAAADAALLDGNGQSQAVGLQETAAAPADSDTTEATTSALTNSIAEAYAQAEAAADAAGNTVATMASAPADAAAADGDAAAAPAEPAPAGDA